MKTALCLGGAACLWNDIEKCPVPFDCVVACNDAGVVWPGRLDAWVSLHPKKFKEKWVAERAELNHPPALALYGHNKKNAPAGTIETQFIMPGTKVTGSSGLFMAKVALIDMGIDRIILCGTPMLHEKHFFGGGPWSAHSTYRRPWVNIEPELMGRMRSMSGWTRLLLGSPEDWAC